jgi:hypothetical protein
MLLIAGQRVTSAEDLQAEAPNGHRPGMNMAAVTDPGIIIESGTHAS